MSHHKVQTKPNTQRSGSNPFPTVRRKSGPQHAKTGYNRLKLIKDVAALLDMPERKTRPIVNAILQAMTRALQTGDKLYIADFGTFVHRKTGGRYVGMNIPGMLTGKYLIPRHSTIVFVPGISLKYLLNKDLYDPEG